jgi:serine phosphatase RsbU (regulator of sigma subunit)
VRRRETVPIESSAIPIGMFCQGRFPARELVLEPGDCLALYTDGLTEARNGNGAEYGIDRLRDLLAAHHGSAPDAAARACAADWRAFRNGAPAADDLTILMLRRTPPVT